MPDWKLEVKYVFLSYDIGPLLKQSASEGCMFVPAVSFSTAQLLPPSEDALKFIVTRLVLVFITTLLSVMVSVGVGVGVGVGEVPPVTVTMLLQLVESF